MAKWLAGSRRFSLARAAAGLQRYDFLKGKPFLMLYGSPKSSKRAHQVYDSAVAAGAKATLQEMKGVGHAFPESQYPAVRGWLRGPATEPE